MRRLALVLAVLGFFLNPGFACSPSDEPQFHYGEPEMKAAVEGTWLLTLRASDGTLSETTLQIAESSKAQAWLSPTAPGGSYGTGVIRAAAACGSRTFVKAAGACTDGSEMPLDIVVTGGDPRFQGVSSSGGLSVPSTYFTQGMLSLKLGDFSVMFNIAPSGATSLPSGGTMDTAVVSLVRTSI
jgi:hypothetical protein